MATPLNDYLSRHAPRLIEVSLRRVEGKPASFVTQDDQYRQLVMQPGWESLPQPIRVLLKRQHTGWEEMYFALRERVYDLTKGVVDVRPGVQLSVSTLLRRHMGLVEPAAAETRGKVSPATNEPKPGGPPLAHPVRGSAVKGDVPLAHYVEGSPPSATGPIHPAEIPIVAEGEDTPGADIPVGIDLGTTFSLIAHIDGQGRPCSIPNSHGDLLTPSVVLFEDGGTVVGKEAVLASADEPDRVAEYVKRDMGAKAFRKPIHGEYLPPEVISSMILLSLKADAQRKLGVVRRAVITVPAYFEETRRRATMDAGKLAGLEVLDIINEPTAAAIAYGYQLGFLDRSGRSTTDRPLRVLVYDLGGGTFDVTIVEILGSDFKALATDGDVSLGGKDWDDKLVEIAADRFRQQHRDDPRDNPVSFLELERVAEAAKRTLTERKKAALYVNHLGSRLKVEVTREEFEEATAGLLQRTRMTSELVVRQAGLIWADIDRVLLVGGSTRMPMVQEMLEQVSGKKPDQSISPDEAVAHGAALYAELLAPRRGDIQALFTVTNVNSHSLGILGSNPETGARFNKVIIPKNSPLPQTVTKAFQTLKPNQRSIMIKVLEGESEDPQECTNIGVCVIRNLPQDLPAGWPIRVTYSYEPNGRLHVSARVKGYTAGVSTDFERENGLPDDDLDLWMQFVRDEPHEDD